MERVRSFRFIFFNGLSTDLANIAGHFETVPYNNSTLRSVYHIRSYDVAKLMQVRSIVRSLGSCFVFDAPQLPRSEPSIFLSHDWPISIPNHGDTASLLRRKPFFRSEVQTNTLGSPPLLALLRHIQPQFWFAAHLHVKFAAVFTHSIDSSSAAPVPGGSEAQNLRPLVGNPEEIALDDMEASSAANPDEIIIEDDSDNEVAQTIGASCNPEEIIIDDDDMEWPSKQTPPVSHIGDPSATGSEARQSLSMDESADLVEAVRSVDGLTAAQGVLGVPKAASLTMTSPQFAGGSGRVTKFLALDKCGPGKDFIQVHSASGSQDCRLSQS